MGKYKVVLSESAYKELVQHKKTGNKSINNKIKKILIELEEDPYKGEGQPEALKYNMSGFWSRRINKEHRIIYSVNNDTVTVFVISTMGQYLDK